MDEIFRSLEESGNTEEINVKDLQAFMRQYDQDGDGRLNYHEFLNYLMENPKGESSHSSWIQFVYMHSAIVRYTGFCSVFHLFRILVPSYSVIKFVLW